MGHAMDLKTQFGEILRANKIQDEILDVTTRNAPELKGAHMASLIEYATIDFVEPSKKPLELFLKKTMSTRNEIMDENFRKIAEKEGLLLTQFVTDMRNFCKDKTGSDAILEGLFPDVYHADEHVIIMDNLLKQDYVMLPKKDKLDLETAKLVLKNIANFHAVTYGLIQNVPGGRQELEKKYSYIQDIFMTPESAEMMNPMFDSSINLICGILEKVGDEESHKICSLLKKRLGNYFNEVLETMTSEEIFPVINHGDLWNNNMLFRNVKLESHREVLFVDLQLARFGSPNLDLGYYMFTSLKPEVRKKWRELLEYYFAQFKKTVISFGMDFPFTFEKFVEDFKLKAKLGFFMGLVLIIGFEAMDGHDTDEAHKNGSDFAEDWNKMMNTWVEQNQEKGAKVAAEFKDFVNDYLSFAEL